MVTYKRINGFKNEVGFYKFGPEGRLSRRGSSETDKIKRSKCENTHTNSSGMFEIGWIHVKKSKKWLTVQKLRLKWVHVQKRRKIEILCHFPIDSSLSIWKGLSCDLESIGTWYKPQQQVQTTIGNENARIGKSAYYVQNEKMAKSQENGYGTNLASKVVLECHNIHKRNTS